MISISLNIHINLSAARGGQLSESEYNIYMKNVCTKTSERRPELSTQPHIRTRVYEFLCFFNAHIQFSSPLHSPIQRNVLFFPPPGDAANHDSSLKWEISAKSRVKKKKRVEKHTHETWHANERRQWTCEWNVAEFITSPALTSCVMYSRTRGTLMMSSARFFSFSCTFPHS